jgi:hypothetical protein
MRLSAESSRLIVPFAAPAACRAARIRANVRRADGDQPLAFERRLQMEIDSALGVIVRALRVGLVDARSRRR